MRYINIYLLLLLLQQGQLLLPTLQRGSSDHGATEDWTFKTQAPCVHEIPHWRIRCVPLRYVAHAGGTLPAGLSDSDQNLRAETWPADTPVREKIYGSVENFFFIYFFNRSTYKTSVSALSPSSQSPKTESLVWMSTYKTKQNKDIQVDIKMYGW